MKTKINRKFLWIATALAAPAIFLSATRAGENSDLPVISSDLPFDVTIPSTSTVLETTIRRDFDIFSWESFIALNWKPNSSQQIGLHGDNATVWESWTSVGDIFLPDGKKPQPWGSPGTAPSACDGAEGKVLSQVGKTPNVLEAVSQPFKTGPLIDQNGVYTRFEILVNEEMFDYIYDNGLYSFDGQQKFNKPAVFPEGSNSKEVWGAIMVKASWKELSADDDHTRFHTSEALIYDADTDQCRKAKVGLVGMHIGTKTEICPQWIWSTFEQIDNVPTFGHEDEQSHYNYYNKDNDYPVNQAPARPWDPEKEGQTPSQIVRYQPIFEGTAALNKQYQEALKAINRNSVWQYYELVGTQWPVHPEDLPLGDPFPEFMANATLESYIQGIDRNGKIQLIPNVTSSCMGCHNGATMLANGKASDFTFILERAQ